MVLLGIASELLILAFIMYQPFVNAIFNTTPVPLEFVLLALPFAVLLFVADELRKYFIRRGSTTVTKVFGW